MFQTCLIFFDVSQMWVQSLMENFGHVIARLKIEILWYLCSSNFFVNKARSKNLNMVGDQYTNSLIHIALCCRTSHSFRLRQCDSIWIQIPGRHFRCNTQFLLHRWSSGCGGYFHHCCNSGHLHHTWSIGFLVKWSSAPDAAFLLLLRHCGLRYWSVIQNEYL